MEIPKNISGKTFLITGGASGLGAVFAETFLKEGAKKVAIVDIAEVTGRVTADNLNGQYPGRVIFVKCDVRKEEDISKAFDEVVTEFGQVDVVVNNAGILNETPVGWRMACEINLEGMISFTMKGLKHMRRDTGGAGGTIISISSAAAMGKWRQIPVYSATKAAILHFSLTLAEKPFYEETGVRVMVLCPGAADTDILRRINTRIYDQKLAAEFQKNVTDLVLQRPESVAAAVLKIYKEGSNGSAWYVGRDKPARDFTPLITNYFSQLESWLSEESFEE